jgi:hypothetical protein
MLRNRPEGEITSSFTEATTSSIAHKRKTKTARALNARHCAG